MRSVSIKSARTVFALVLAVLLAGAVGMALCVQKAYAGTLHVETAEGTQYVVYYPSYPSYESANTIQIPTKGRDSNFKDNISGLKSSNEKVLTVEALNFYGGRIEVHLEKAGKAKVTYTYQGKKHTITFVVKKYANPVKTFKVGSKNYASKFNKDYISVLYDQEKLSGKLEISPNKNWKLKKIWLSKARTSKVVKNGDKISGYGVRATLKNTKTKVTEDIELDVDDGN